MPFTINSTNLPKYIKNRPEATKQKWVSIFNSVFKDSGEEAAFIAANSWLRRQAKEIVARSTTARSRITFTISDTELIKRSDDGEDYVTAILANTDTNKDGKIFSEGLLQKWTKEINQGNTLVGDVDHELYDKLMDSNVSDSMFQTLLKGKKGIAKAVRAVYDKGKMFVKLLIDKRYRQQVLKSKGLSVEAIVNPGLLKSEGDILGFTFNLNTENAIPGTGVLA